MACAGHAFVQDTKRKLEEALEAREREHVQREHEAERAARLEAAHHSDELRLSQALARVEELEARLAEEQRARREEGEAASKAAADQAAAHRCAVERGETLLDECLRGKGSPGRQALLWVQGGWLNIEGERVPRKRWHEACCASCGGV